MSSPRLQYDWEKLIQRRFIGDLLHFQPFTLKSNSDTHLIPLNSCTSIYKLEPNLGARSNLNVNIFPINFNNDGIVFDQNCSYICSEL